MYSKTTGIIKTIKNAMFFYAIPIILVLIENQAEWVPAKYEYTIAGILGLISYFIKNYHENK